MAVAVQNLELVKTGKMADQNTKKPDISSDLDDSNEPTNLGVRKDLGEGSSGTQGSSTMDTDSPKKRSEVYYGPHWPADHNIQTPAGETDPETETSEEEEQMDIPEPEEDPNNNYLEYDSTSSEEEDEDEEPDFTGPDYATGPQEWEFDEDPWMAPDEYPSSPSPEPEPQMDPEPEFTPDYPSVPPEIKPEPGLEEPEAGPSGIQPNPKHETEEKDTSDETSSEDETPQPVRGTK